MAEGKKAFVLYCDLIHTVRKMPEDKAGRLFMTILGYVNDENPAPDDLVVDLVFEPIKQQLKRDLKKWERFIERQRENGKRGGRPQKPNESQKTQAFLEKPKKADTDTVTDTVTVKDISIDSPPVKFNIEHCLTIALLDERWKKANKAEQPELESFNNYLEKQARYDMNPADYKRYFSIIKDKYPKLLNGTRVAGPSFDELLKQAEAIDRKNGKYV